ncbi:MAG: putative lipid II flippase FtsW [Ruminococcaceae bacterium]|nr:putative lipid II flippase FtsW [Oscillospiraceae bacterium]
MDESMLFIVIMLVGIGLVMLYSAGYATAASKKAMDYDPNYFVKNQGIYAVIGFIGLYVASRFDYHLYAKLNPIIAAGTLVLMYLTPFIGTSVKGARRWLFGFQPSEIAKFAIIVFFATMMCKMGKKRMKTFRWGFLFYLGCLGVLLGSLVLQKHLSAIMIISITCGIMMFVGGTRFVYLVTLVGIGVTGAVAYILKNTYAMARIKVWLDPFSDFRGAGWQASQSWMAISSGGLWGMGLGQGRQKHLFLPEPANDFIFAVICEELGFVGAMLVLIVFAFFIIRGYVIAIKAADKFGTLIATGITTHIALQIIMNICVVSGLMPVTGISLPFFSYGGTSLVVLLCEVGVLLNISRFKAVLPDEEVKKPKHSAVNGGLMEE